jgi:hypothetical protein
VEDAALGAAKKNARRHRTWLVFEDESGISQQPVVRRTWAPRGETPVLRPTGGNWEAPVRRGRPGLSLGWAPHPLPQPGSYTDATLIRFLRTLKHPFRAHRILLIWDGLGAHKSQRMRTYLNPVEPIWGNVKTRELANVCAPELTTLHRPLRAGFARVRRHPDLAFLRRAGLTL